jgi:hypothetical protein
MCDVVVLWRAPGKAARLLRENDMSLVKLDVKNVAIGAAAAGEILAALALNRVLTNLYILDKTTSGPRSCESGI